MTDQETRELLAEKVMGWRRDGHHPDGTPTFKSPERFGLPDTDLAWTVVGENYWDPFFDSYNTLELIQALLPISVSSVHSTAADGNWRVWTSGYPKHWEVKAVSGEKFPRVVTEAVLKLLRERPELFGGTNG